MIKYICYIIYFSLGATFSASPALSVVSPLSHNQIENIEVNKKDNEVSVQLRFASKITVKDLEKIQERNFIQVTVPALMKSSQIERIGLGGIEKVFAYPYVRFDPTTKTPLSRVRIIFDAQTALEGALTKLKLKQSGANAIVVSFPIVPKKEKGVPAISESATTQLEETILDEVIASEKTKVVDLQDTQSVKDALRKPNSDALSAVDKKANATIGVSDNPSNHFAKMVISLVVVLGLFVGIVFGLKRYAANSQFKIPGLNIGKHFAKRERLIQVVASHYFGAKKSISIVKIAGEYMVVSITDQKISLLSKLGPEAKMEKVLEERFWGGQFEKHLDAYAGDARLTKDVDLDQLMEGPAYNVDTEAKTIEAQVHASAPAVTDFRKNIKEKLKSLKPLS